MGIHDQERQIRHARNVAPDIVSVLAGIDDECLFLSQQNMGAGTLQYTLDKPVSLLDRKRCLIRFPQAQGFQFVVFTWVNNQSLKPSIA